MEYQIVITWAKVTNSNKDKAACKKKFKLLKKNIIILKVSQKSLGYISVVFVTKLMNRCIHWTHETDLEGIEHHLFTDQ